MVTLEPVHEEDADVLDRLYQLYAHDWSEHLPLSLDDRGRFDVSVSRAWWSDAARWPFFLREEGRLVGFALVSRGSRAEGSEDAMDVGELFVARGARRRGVGAAAVRALFARFPGPWEVRVRGSNGPARAFWARVLGAPVRTWIHDGVEWHVHAWSPYGQSD